MQAALIFTDDNEQLRASCAKHVRLGSIALICVAALSSCCALLGVATVLSFGAESDDAGFITSFAAIGVTYVLLAIRKWAHVTFIIATVLNVLLLLAELIGTGMEILEGINVSSIVLLVVTAGQVVVTAITARGLQFARKLHRIRPQLSASQE